MHHLDPRDTHHHDSGHHDHHLKEGSWFKGGSLAHHRPGFFGSHLAGTFHHSPGVDLSLPSDHLCVLRILP